MSIHRYIYSLSFVSLLVSGADAQVVAGQPVRLNRPDPRSLARPPLPSDPLELVTGGAQPIQDADQRGAVTQLLTNAHSLTNVRAQPYDMKTTFTSYGGSASDGTWVLEDVSPGRNVYRWTAQGPNYSGANLYTDSRYYVSDPAAAIPLRLAQVRETLFFTAAPTGPYAGLRTAAGYLNGNAVQCVLVAFGGPLAPLSSGRDWQEAEYCVDPKTGLLMTYSPVPGLYVRYDYSRAIQFHGHTIPGSFLITQGGKTIIEAKTESVTEPPAASSPQFQPTNLRVAGVGSVMTPASRMFSMSFPPSPLSNNVRVDMVVLHSVTSANSEINELEVLLSTDASANQRALDLVTKRPTPMGLATQPGATPQSHEAFYTLEVLSAAN